MTEKFLFHQSNFIDTECKSHGRSVTELAMELVAMVQPPRDIKKFILKNGSHSKCQRLLLLKVEHYLHHLNPLLA
jgi:hypothetical protein